MTVLFSHGGQTLLQVGILHLACGGGALLLEKYIKESGMIGESIFIDDLSANAKGYEKMAKVIKETIEL